LIEQGAKKLTQFYTKLIAEASSGTPPSSNSSQIEPPPFPTSVLDTLEPVLVSLRGLPLPATHPSHPAAPGIFQALKEAQKGYGDMRGTWARKCLEGVGVRRVVERVETMDGIKGGKEMGRWVSGLLSVADVRSSHLPIFVA
jgi:exocyst complex component 7